VFRSKGDETEDRSKRIEQEQQRQDRARTRAESEDRDNGEDRGKSGESSKSLFE
jgi:hypothetical protein